MNVTNIAALHTKLFPELVTVYFSSARVANDADGTSTKNMTDVSSRGVRVQLCNGSSKCEFHGACAAHTFDLYHYSCTLKVPVCRECMRVYTPGKLNILK